MLQRVYHEIQVQQVRVRLRVLNASFNNISVISRMSVVLVKLDTGVPGKNTDLSQLLCDHDSLSNQK